MRLPYTLVCFGVLLVLAGCGGSPAVPGPAPLAPPARPMQPQPMQPRPLPAPMAPPYGDVNAPSPALARLAQAWAGVRTLGYTIEYSEQGGGEETGTVKATFRKPGRYRYEVTASSKLLFRGSRSVFDTTSRKITARLPGIASIVPIKGTLDDDRARSIRRYKLDQTDYASQVEFLLGGQARPMPGADPFTLEFERPALYPDVERMRVGLDPRTGLLASVDLFAGGKQVHKRRYTATRPNPSVDSSALEL